MKKWIAFIVVSVSMGLMFAGCSAKQTPEEQKVVAEKAAQQALAEQKMAYTTNDAEKSFVVYGEGISPQHTISPAQAMALAKRAAITDGYRQLGEKLYGAKINATDTVKDAALKDSRITSNVKGVIKDAAVTDATFKDGLYTVRMEVTMSTRRWTELFAY